MLRTLALLLVAANLGFWAWTQGWMSPGLPPPLAGEREPERLQRQVRPESLTVLAPRAAAEARRAETVRTSAASAAAASTNNASATEPAEAASAAAAALSSNTGSTSNAGPTAAAR